MSLFKKTAPQPPEERWLRYQQEVENVAKMCGHSDIMSWPPLSTIRNHVKHLEFELATLREENAAVVTIIERLDDPKIPREGRALHDWLAQILQVLVMDRDNNATDRDRLREENARLTEENEDRKDMLMQSERDVRQLRADLDSAITACKLALPFIQAADWVAHDPNADPPPFREQRKGALKAIEHFLNDRATKTEATK